jgi:cytochrome P450
MENPSLLRFLVDMRGEDVSNVQLRDDLMTMLIAGHETTAALLTWTFFELSQQPELMNRLRKEVDDVLEGRQPTYEDITNMPLMRYCLAETLRMYPEPPLLIRRALEDDVLPQGGAADKTFIPRGTDIFISTWNLHRSPLLWENPDKYDPDRFTREFKNPSQKEWAGFKPGGNKSTYPNEIHSDFAFIPFGGGARKCVGDQFAMMESIATVSMILQRYDVKLAHSAEYVGMKTGATIHTENGMDMIITPRKSSQ